MSCDFGNSVEAVIGRRGIQGVCGLHPSSLLPFARWFPSCSSCCRLALSVIPRNWPLLTSLWLGKKGQLYKHGYSCYHLVCVGSGGCPGKGGRARPATQEVSATLHSWLPITYTHIPITTHKYHTHHPQSQAFPQLLCFRDAWAFTAHFGRAEQQRVKVSAEGTQPPDTPTPAGRGEGGGSSEGSGQSHCQLPREVVNMGQEDVGPTQWDAWAWSQH